MEFSLTTVVVAIIVLVVAVVLIMMFAGMSEQAGGSFTSLNDWIGGIMGQKP